MNQDATEKPIRVGVFTNPDNAAKAIQELKKHGFQNEHLSVICSDETRKRHIGETTSDDMKSTVEDTEMPRAELTATGGTLGAALGGMAGAASLATMGGAAVVIAGAMGVALAGGVAGSFAGAMMSRGVEKEPADFYDLAVQEGKLLVAVEYEGAEQAEKLAEAEKILDDAGAEPLALREG